MQLSVIRLGPDDYGLYVSHARGAYNTPLVARGTEAFVRGLDPTVKMSGYVMVYVPDDTHEDGERTLTWRELGLAPVAGLDYIDRI